MERLILDNPGPMKMVLHSQLLDSSGTNETRDSIKMKLCRNGDGYCAKLIAAWWNTLYASTSKQFLTLLNNKYRLFAWLM